VGTDLSILIANDLAVTNPSDPLGSEVIGTCAVGDVLAVVYDGQFVYYVQNGSILKKISAAPGLWLNFAAVLRNIGDTVSAIRFGLHGNSFYSRAGNLIDASWWAAGIDPHAVNSSGGQWQAGWLWTGSTTDSFVMATLPDGAMGIVLSGNSSVDSSGPGPGWDAGPGNPPTNNFPVNPSKTYLYAVYARRASGINGGVDWGIDTASVCDLNTSTPATNPFAASLALFDVPVGDWSLLVGWIYPAGTTGYVNGKAGAYSCTTGELLAQGVNYTWRADTAYAQTRAYSYYGAVGLSEQHWAWPMVYVCDGSEPSMDDLLSMITTTQQIAPYAVSDQWTLFDAVGVGYSNVA
jgi:hypothetical protein